MLPPMGSTKKLQKELYIFLNTINTGSNGVFKCIIIFICPSLPHKPKYVKNKDLVPAACKGRNSRKGKLITVTTEMHLLLNRLYCSYSSCIGSLVSCCYCSIHSLVHFPHVISFLCSSTCFLKIRTKR